VIDYVHVKQVLSGLDTEQLWTDTNNIITQNSLQECFQVSYSSIDGANNWLDIRPQSVSPDGTTLEMAKPGVATSIKDYVENIDSVTGIPAKQYSEELYKKPCADLVGTYTHELMLQFPEFYRWRLLRSRSGQILNVHRDKPGFVRAINPDYADQYLIQERLHIVIKTNPQCHMMFCEDMPEANTQTTAHYYQFPAGTAWLFDTSIPHTAMNFSYEDRYHLTAVRNVPGTDPFQKQAPYKHDADLPADWQDR